MTPEMVELARRAVACKGWRWMAGMRRVWPFLVREPISQGTVWSCLARGEDRARGYIERMPSERVEDDLLSLEPSEKWDDATDQWMADIPDLTDPATLGCLLALVREAWGDPAYLWGGHAEVRRDSETLFVVLRFGHDANGFLVERWVSSGTTEAEALVAALEAAP